MPGAEPNPRADKYCADQVVVMKLCPQERDAQQAARQGNNMGENFALRRTNLLDPPVPEDIRKPGRKDNQVNEAGQEPGIQVPGCSKVRVMQEAIESHRKDDDSPDNRADCDKAVPRDGTVFQAQERAVERPTEG